MSVDMQSIAIEVTKEQVAAAEDSLKLAQLRRDILLLVIETQEGRLKKADLINKLVKAAGI